MAESDLVSVVSVVTVFECELLDEDAAAIAAMATIATMTKRISTKVVSLIGSPMKFVVLVTTLVTVFVVVVMVEFAALTFPIPCMNARKIIVVMLVVNAKFFFNMLSHLLILLKYLGLQVLDPAQNELEGVGSKKYEKIDRI